MKITELKKLQEIFIEAGDWDEVSNIQYKIDGLPPSEKIEPVHFETWFKLIIMENFFNSLKQMAEDILEVGRVIEEAEKRKGTYNEK